MPQRPEIMKNIILFSGVGLQTKSVTIRATCRDSAKHITGLRPVILTMLPEHIDAMPLQTPKHIITNPILLIPHPQDTKA